MLKFYRTKQNGVRYLEAYYKGEGEEWLFVAHDPPDMTPRGYRDAFWNAPAEGIREFDPVLLEEGGEPVDPDELPEEFVEWVGNEVKGIEIDLSKQKGGGGSKAVITAPYYLIGVAMLIVTGIYLSIANFDIRHGYIFRAAVDISAALLVIGLAVYVFYLTKGGTV